MAKILDVKFLGDDIDKLLSETLKSIDPDKWQKKKNSLINRGLKQAAMNVLPQVWQNQRHDTGIMQMFTDIKRMRGGGWRISTPKREELELKHPEIKKSKGYYPMAMEYGFKSKSGDKIAGDSALKRAMNTKRAQTTQKLVDFYKTKLESMMKRHLKKRGK